MAVAWMVGDSNLLYAVKHELKEHGVKIGKLKAHARTNSSSQFQDKDESSPVFGVPLLALPCCKDLQTGLEIPRFVRECVDFLSSHVKEEGLFRKSGSHARQKELQERLGNGEPIPPDSVVADVASTLKRFLRDLPEPMIPARYQSVMLKCVLMEDEILQEWTSLLLLCLLPFKNLQLLRYVMLFLGRVSAESENNKMDTKNLAKVLMPTIMGSDSAGKGTQVERQIRLKTLALEVMIANAKDIGVVPDSVLDRMKKVKSRSSESLDYLTSEDELDRSSDDNLEPRSIRRKRRSGTFQGIVNGLEQVGYKVGVLLKPSGSLDNLDQTPEYRVETPREPRSAKRKATEDIGSVFSATKRRTPSPMQRGTSMMRRSLRTRRKSSPIRSRKAVMKQTTAEKQPRKFRGPIRSDPSSPMTPLQPAKPPLGEVDAVDSAGKTLFHFDTPSIKFADDSFSGFTSSPSAAQATMENPSAAGITPRKNKLKKLNPLNSKRFKRMSLGTIGGSGRTPHKLPVSRQVHPYIQDRSSIIVGHRLAKEANPEGFDTLHLVPRHPECRDGPVRCPSTETKEDIPTEGMYTTPLYLRQEGEAVIQGETGPYDGVLGSSDATTPVNYPIQRHDGRVSTSFTNKQETREHPRHHTDSQWCHSSDVNPVNHRIQDRGGRVATSFTNKQATRDHRLEYTDSRRCHSSEATPVNYPIQDCSGGVATSFTNKQETRDHPLQYTDSQRSLSSILSSVTVQSTKSYFSIEEVAGMAVEPLLSPAEEPGDIKDATLTPSSPGADKMDISELDEEECDETQSEPTLACSQAISRSLQSLDSTPSKEKTAAWILKKTISVDSGRGDSLEDLQTAPQDQLRSELPVTVLPSPTSPSGDAIGDTDSLVPQAVTCQATNFSKVNPSKLKPLRVGHDASTLDQFHRMQERLKVVPPNKDAKSVRQKIQMFNMLSKDDMSPSMGRRGLARRVKHHSGSDLPSCQYTRDSSGGFLGTPNLQTMSLSPLVKSVSHDTGISELGRHLREEEDMYSTPLLPRPSGLRRPSCKSTDEDSFDAAMNASQEVRSQFKQFSTPIAKRKPLGNRNSSVINHARPSPVGIENMGSPRNRSPLVRGTGSPRKVRKQLKRLHSENNSSWQRYSPRRAFTGDNYMHRLKSPRDHHGSPRQPLERRVSRRSRPIRKEWQV